jgi:hypothetical protein
MGKTNPKAITEGEFISLLASAPKDKPADKWIVSSFMGIAPVVAREIVLKASGRTDTLIDDCEANFLWSEFSYVADIIKTECFSPTLALDGEKCIEYSFIDLSQYASLEIKRFESAGKLLDAYFASRDNDIESTSEHRIYLSFFPTQKAEFLKK